MQIQAGMDRLRAAAPELYQSMGLPTLPPNLVPAPPAAPAPASAPGTTGAPSPGTAPSPAPAPTIAGGDQFASFMTQVGVGASYLEVLMAGVQIIRRGTSALHLNGPTWIIDGFIELKLDFLFALVIFLDSSQPWPLKS